MDVTLPAPAIAGAAFFRTSLIERVRAARPSIIALVAPAGFGKSAFVRQLLEGSPYAVCDCRGVRSDADLARQMIPALATENPDRSASLSQSEAMLGEGHSSSTDRVSVALAAWRVRPPSASTFVFENAEDAIADPAARELLGKLIGEPPGRTDDRHLLARIAADAPVAVRAAAPDPEPARVGPRVYRRRDARDLRADRRERAERRARRGDLSRAGRSRSCCSRGSRTKAGWIRCSTSSTTSRTRNCTNTSPTKYSATRPTPSRTDCSRRPRFRTRPSATCSSRWRTTTRSTRSSRSRRRRRSSRAAPTARSRCIRSSRRRCSNAIRRAWTRSSRPPPPRTRAPRNISGRRKSISAAETSAPPPTRSSTSR